MKYDINVDLTMKNTNVRRLMVVTQDRFVIGGGFTPRLLTSFGLVTHCAKPHCGYVRYNKCEICNKLTSVSVRYISRLVENRLAFQGGLCSTE